MWFRAKDYNLIIKNEHGYLIAIIRKKYFKYCFFNRYNEALKIIENIKKQI